MCPDGHKTIDRRVTPPYRRSRAQFHVCATLTSGGTTMAATTDYDAPRRSTLEEAETESLEVLATARTDAQSPDADLIGEELSMPVIPKKADEFTCTSCFLVQHRSRIASGTSDRAICIDC